MKKTVKREEALYHVRRSVKEFMHRISEFALDDPIVEVGKMMDCGKICEEFPEFYVDTKKMFHGKRLIQMDIDANTKPDICDDLLNIDKHFRDNEVGAVILLHVLEHVRNFWKVPDKLHKILKHGGFVFIQTPWNFRFHGPRPDCWRISDDGYETLFKEKFKILLLEKYNPFNDYLHPLLINVVLWKE